MLPERLVWAHPFKCSYLFMIPCCCCCLNVGVGGRDLQQRHAMHLCLFAAISSLFLFGPAAAQFGGFGGPAAKEGAPAVKSDIPYIRCSACEALAKNAYRQIKTVKDAQKPGKKVRGTLRSTAYFRDSIIMLERYRKCCMRS